MEVEKPWLKEKKKRRKVSFAFPPHSRKINETYQGGPPMLFVPTETVSQNEKLKIKLRVVRT